MEVRQSGILKNLHKLTVKQTDRRTGKNIIWEGGVWTHFWKIPSYPNISSLVSQFDHICLSFFPISFIFEKNILVQFMF